ncbi:hypothetical protein [Robiginitalea marina]|uniref:Sensor of ECF-type sigma factor n=1 Tax=Robiginitalea marina TaxID=2954105 RepID=A0ABT1B0H7_9FLAO|nr:hypothetical protein [Robiginitalea marina]MCO5725407.1 hypothetical protein [Robiginitalea marina]
MKTVLISMSVLILGILSGRAQSNVEEIDFIQSIFGAEKKQITSMFINLEGQQADAFWKLYDEYEVKRKLLGKERFELIRRYAEEYSGITAEQTDELMGKAIKLRNANNKLVDTYYKKIRKAAGSIAAAQFHQLESYIQAEIRTELFESIPIIGELDD